MSNFISKSGKRKSRRSKAHARTSKTYQNKIRKLQSFYKLHPKMKEKYPTFEAWLKILNVKQIGKEKEAKYTSVISGTQKKSTWGI